MQYYQANNKVFLLWENEDKHIFVLVKVDLHTTNEMLDWCKNTFGEALKCELSNNTWTWYPPENFNASILCHDSLLYTAYIFKNYQDSILFKLAWE